MSFEFLEMDRAARIKVVGVGGGGGNAINNMIAAELRGVEFIGANTDAQALEMSRAGVKVQLGSSLTKGLGAGAKPEVGREAAEEAVNEIRAALQGSDMVFVTAGMGGGTGTGGAPVIAEVSKELGALTVAVVTRPFAFEGKQRMQQAEAGIERLRQVVDTIITIPNDRLRSLAQPNTTLIEMFRKADEVLYYAVRGISDLIVVQGYVNVDFADVRTVMSEMGLALMGTGVGRGQRRAAEAVQMAIANPLLEDISINGARGILMNITASSSTLSMEEVDQASSLIHKEAHEDANIIWGTVFDEGLAEEIRVTVIATGIGKEPASIDIGHRAGASVTLAQWRTEAQSQAHSEKHPSIERPHLESVGRSVAKNGEEKQRFGAGWGFDDLDEAQLEVPTFLRRKAE